jgi:hypothetical protein
MNLIILRYFHVRDKYGKYGQPIDFQLSFEHSEFIVLDTQCGKKFGHSCPKFCGEKGIVGSLKIINRGS